MIDLDNLELTIPKYKLKSKGAELEYDALALGYGLRVLAGIDDPERIREVVKEVFKLQDRDLSTFEACVLLEDFKKFIEEDSVCEPLKKVFGRSPFSATSTTSNPEKSGD